MKDRESEDQPRGLVEQILSVKTQADLPELRRAVLGRVAAGLMGKRKAKRLQTLLDELELVLQGQLIARLTSRPLSPAAQDVARCFDRLRSPERRARVVDLVRAERDAEARQEGGSEVRFGPPGRPPWPVT